MASRLPKVVQFVKPCALDNGKRHVKGLLLGVCKAVDKEVLRVIRSNADALHSFVKLLLCGRHGKPHAARFACFKAGAAVDKNGKLFAHVFAPF